MKPRDLLRLSFPLASAIAALLAFSSVRAGQIWDGGGGDNNWNTAGNWDGDVLPTFTNAITFVGNTRNGAVNNLTADTLIGGINLTNDSTSGKTNAFTLSGTRITLGGDITTTASSSAITDTISLSYDPGWQPGHHHQYQSQSHRQRDHQRNRRCAQPHQKWCGHAALRQHQHLQRHHHDQRGNRGG